MEDSNPFHSKLAGRGHNLQTLKGCLLQFLAMIRMGDLDKFKGTLSHSFAK